MRSFGEIGRDTVQGAVHGGFWGALIGAGCVLAVPLTGGASLAGIAAVLPAAGGAALLGGKIGGGVGAAMGATGYKEEIDKVAGVVMLGAGASAAGISLPGDTRA